MVEKRKRELVDRLANARAEISFRKTRVSDELNIARQLKRSVQSNPLGWFAGSLGTVAVLGFLTGGRRSSKPRRRRGLLAWGLGFAFSMAKPTLTKLVVTRLKNEFEQRLTQASSKSMLGAPSQK